MATSPDAPTISTVDISTVDNLHRRRFGQRTRSYGSCSGIRDLLVAPSAENVYTTLKQLLISRLLPSEPQRLQQLLNDTYIAHGPDAQRNVVPHEAAVVHGRCNHHRC
ncbi:hypothetical protein MRX96_020507 [Rhipicephalus microplus]